MKASDLYNSYSTEVDSLQRSIKNSVSDQFTMVQSLSQKQDKMKRLMTIITAGGDRDLTGVEVLQLAQVTLTKDVPSPLAVSSLKNGTGLEK